MENIFFGIFMVMKAIMLKKKDVAFQILGII